MLRLSVVPLRASAKALVALMLLLFVGCGDDTPPSSNKEQPAITVTFSKDSKHPYGYDKYEKMTALYYSHDPEIQPGPDYDFVSVEKNSAGFVRVEIKGADPSQIYFTSEDEGVLKPHTEQVAQSPATLQIDGQNTNKAMKHLYARHGGKTGTIVGKLGVCVYKKHESPKAHLRHHIFGSA